MPTRGNNVKLKKLNVMEAIKEVVKSIIEKKVNSMSFDELIEAAYGQGTKYVIVESDETKVKEAFGNFINKMTKEELRVALTESWCGAEGCAEDAEGKLSLCGVGGFGGLIFITDINSMEEAQNSVRLRARYKMERDYRERLENKMESILDEL